VCVCVCVCVRACGRPHSPSSSKFGVLFARSKFGVLFGPSKLCVLLESAQGPTVGMCGGLRQEFGRQAAKFGTVPADLPGYQELWRYVAPPEKQDAIILT
jgi:hypothetical protein